MSAELRIAIVGFGMSGVGCLSVLRHAEQFAQLSQGFVPKITVFEALPRVGGKAAPANLGAQFLDADALYPFDRLLDEHGLATHPARNDYELVRLKLRNMTIDGDDFARALEVVRQSFAMALRDEPFAELDARSVLQVLHQLQRTEHLTSEEHAAMKHRLLLEEGTTNLSSLYYALCLAKTRTPARRLEVVGGLQRIAAAERKAAAADGVTFFTETIVDQVDLQRGQVRVYFRRDGAVDEAEFDAVVLALSPEHLRHKHLRVVGSPMPLRPITNLRPSRITKSNLSIRNPVRAEEHATERYALWFTPDAHTPRDQSMTTFFHGWEGQTPLSVWQMLRTAIGHTTPNRLVRFESQTWDGVAQPGEVPMAYISQPAPGECLPLLRLARDQYFRGSYDSGPLRVASHALGFGGTVREAALSGEWAALSLLRGWGHDISPALGRTSDPELELFGASREALAAALGT